MKIWVDGRALTLRKKEFVAQGGEGSVYVRGDVAYKLYCDPANALAPAKLNELGAIRHPRVIKPEKLVTDSAGAPIGYAMQYVAGAEPLCRTFTRAYRERVGLEPARMFDLVRDLAEGVAAVHAASVLIVDLNELNFLVGPGHDHIWFIDVDSYQTAHFPATAIMDSVRDRHEATFSARTDWFSFAVVSFQMLVGIHPYKGKHPLVNGLEQRMQKNLSVFDPDVRVPKSAWPLDTIPEPWRTWYASVLQDGARTAPPLAAGAAAIVLPAPTALATGERIEVDLEHAFDGAIRAIAERLGTRVVVTDTGVWVDRRRVGAAPTGPVTIGFTPRSGRPLLASIRDHRLELIDLHAGRPLPLDLRADALTAYDGRIYLKCRDRILEVVTLEAGGSLVASTRVATNVLEHATHVFDGVVLQDLLGDSWVTVFPEAGVTRPVRLFELDPYTVVDASFDRGVLVVVGARDGRYDRLVFRFTADYETHDLRVVEDVCSPAVDLIVLDHGAALVAGDDDELELFAARPGCAELKRIDHDGLGDARLARLQGRAGFHRGAELYTMALRQSR